MNFKINRVTLILILIFVGECRLNHTDAANTRLAEEIQHAICKIATEDVVASANATVTRELKGVCTTKELMERIDQLEMKLIDEIQAAKDTQFKIKSANPQTQKIKPSSTHTTNLTYQRDLEAVKNNRTILTTELGKSFLYFWKIYDIDDILTYTDGSIESGVFYVKGNAMQVTLHPRHLGTHYAALELSSRKNFIPKHRFVILNQKNEKADLTSQVLGVAASIFRIDIEKVSNEEFIADGTLIVKVIISVF